MSTRQPGRRRAKAAVICWVASLAAPARNPTRSTRAARLAAVLASARAWSNPASTAGTRSASSRPAAVSVIPARDRVNSSTPSWPSSCLICLVSAGWDTNRRSAARVRFPSSATAAKYRRSRVSTSMPSGYGNGYWTRGRPPAEA